MSDQDFRASMPPDLRQLYEESLRRKYLPDPRIGWTDVVRVARGNIRKDESAQGTRRIWRHTRHHPATGRLGDLQRAVEIFPTGHSDTRKIFTARTWARPNEPSNVVHLYVRNVLGEFSALPNITGFTWTVISAKGHRTS